MMPVDLIGWLAAGLTLLTFACRDMRWQRVVALSASAAFLTYGAGADLLHVLTLHALLIPTNLWRLRELVRAAGAANAARATDAALARDAAAVGAPAAAGDATAAAHDAHDAAAPALVAAALAGLAPADSRAPPSSPAVARQWRPRRPGGVAAGGRRALPCRAGRRVV